MTRLREVDEAEVCEPCFEDFATEFGWVASVC
jgi:hypothetical protein